MHALDLATLLVLFILLSSADSLCEVVAFVILPASLSLLFELTVHHAVAQVCLRWIHCQLLLVEHSHRLQVILSFVDLMPVHAGLINLGNSVLRVCMVTNDRL